MLYDAYAEIFFNESPFSRLMQWSKNRCSVILNLDDFVVGTEN
jgi:hypothetical protein